MSSLKQKYAAQQKNEKIKWELNKQNLSILSHKNQKLFKIRPKIIENGFVTPKIVVYCNKLTKIILLQVNYSKFI